MTLGKQKDVMSENELYFYDRQENDQQCGRLFSIEKVNQMAARKIS